MEDRRRDSISNLSVNEECYSKSNSSTSKKNKKILSIIKKANEQGNQKYSVKGKGASCIRNRKVGLTTKNILKGRKKAPQEYVSYDEFKKTVEFMKNNISSRDIFKEKCVAPIHLENRTEKINVGYFGNLLEEARNRLLERDWSGLAKVLIYAKTINQSDYTMYLAVFLKYAIICLCHIPDKKLFHLFCQSVLLCANNEQKDEMLRKIVCLNE